MVLIDASIHPYLNKVLLDLLLDLQLLAIPPSLKFNSEITSSLPSIKSLMKQQNIGSDLEDSLIVVN